MRVDVWKRRKSALSRRKFAKHRSSAHSTFSAIERPIFSPERCIVSLKVPKKSPPVPQNEGEDHGLIKEIDYGTPASQSDRMVTLTIDGQSVTVPRARPSCVRRWRWERKSPNSAPPTPLRPSALVASASSRSTDATALRPPARRRLRQASLYIRRLRVLTAIRRGVMELYISDHPLDCLTCAANGDCELQDMAGAVGLRDVRYGYRAPTMCRAQQWLR